ncbi:glycopeptide [Mycena belliarum]|uniref:Glycopeptide n=1 Tax=Mycena belliarum TaxID=1033014 RepID=A0AAD6XGM5_9AGAR|nr:glycopeptide [Mycena belliae]
MPDVSVALDGPNELIIPWQVKLSTGHILRHLVNCASASGIGTGQEEVKFNGPLISAIAYLQTGGCGFNGESCTLVELTLDNRGSSADLSLIPSYFGGCDGAGADCTGPNCPAAFEDPSQTFKQVGCSAANVNLAITFCD